MRWTLQAAAGLVAIALAGCEGARTDRDTGTAGGGAETGSMNDTMGMGDTAGMSGRAADTARGAIPADTGMGGDSLRMGETREGSDTGEENQTQSGATDTSGQSTLGEGAEQTRPDQGQPVTSKGDTINRGVDSVDSAP